jgi:signal transduction histidine kinase
MDYRGTPLVVGEEGEIVQTSPFEPPLRVFRHFCRSLVTEAFEGELTSQNILKNKGYFTADEIQFVTGLTSQAASAIYNAQLYERTKSQAIELEKSNKVKDEFLNIMSHELKTPLNVILGYLNMLREKMLGDINPEQAKALEVAAKRGGDLLAMVESILEATIIETGNLPVQTDPIDVFRLIEALKLEYKVPIDHEVVLSWECPLDIPVVRTDELKLKRILKNLIENAIKFTKRGHIRVSARHVVEASSIQFDVVDSGIGIPAESLTGIFEIFRQADSSETREFEGVGLGLYIAKELTTMIGGQISVESELGRGSTFTVTIPIRLEESAAAPLAGFPEQNTAATIEPRYAARASSR